MHKYITSTYVTLTNFLSTCNLLPPYLPTYLLPNSPSTHLSVQTSIRPSIHPPIYLSVCPSVCMYICLYLLTFPSNIYMYLYYAIHPITAAPRWRTQVAAAPASSVTGKSRSSNYSSYSFPLLPATKLV